MSTQHPSSAVRVLAVIVLYRRDPDQSEAFQSLLRLIQRLQRDLMDLTTLIYDNTPGITSSRISSMCDVTYKSTGKNLGLASAYNCALAQAESRGLSWLLLLDQDTSLPLDFLDSLCKDIRLYEYDSSVVAIVPTVQSNGAVVSPKRVGFTSLCALPRESHGVQEREITAINSGTAIRCDFIRSIGGFNNAYWLDYLDHWLFRQIYAHGKRAALSQSCLGHQLSVQDYRRNVSMKRYSSILKGEAAFMTTHKLKVQLPFYLLRLTARTVKLTIQGQSDKALLTLQTIMKILRHPMCSLEEHPQ